MSEVKDKKEVTIGDLQKQVNNVAFMVRKMKNWLEEKMGADIDGDGRIGSGPYRAVKKVGAFLLVMGLAAVCSAAPWNTNVAVWVTSTTYIDSAAGMHASTFHGSAAGLTAIPAGSIANSSISNVHLASNAVSSMKIDDGTVSNVDLATDSVTTGKILDGTIVAADLATNAVTSTVINDGSVSNIDLASDISAAKLSAGTVATAIDGNAITNLDATDLLTGTVPNARLDADLQPLAEDDGGGLTNIVSGGIVSLSAAKLQAATVATAIDGNAITNLDASDLLTGTVPNARLDADLQPLAEDDGGGLTNIVSGGIVSLSAAKLQSGTVATAFDGLAVTNLNSTNLTGSIANARLNTNLQNIAIGDAGSLTNLNGAGIASGDIASARLTANAVVVTDFAAANQVLVGSGAGTFTATTGSGQIVVTNASTLSTNLMYFGSGGVLLSNVYNGP